MNMGAFVSGSTQGETMQSIIDEVCGLLNIGPFLVGKGSTEPAAFFVEVARSLNISTRETSSKPVIAQSIVESVGLAWGIECDSRGTASGGGSTVTIEGLRAVRNAVETFTRSSRFESPHAINVRPKTGSLKLFKNLTFKAWYALGEFIDNSITSAILNLDSLKESLGKDYELIVNVSFDDKTNSLVVEDNAAGIAIGDLDRALQTSEPPPDTSRGLSLHGVGMKAAGFWWGQRITIETHPLNSNTAWVVSLDLNEIDSNESDVVEASPIPHRGTPGTRLTIDGLWKGVPKGRTLGAIRAFLPSIYRTFISGSQAPLVGGDSQDLELQLILNGKKLEYSEPALLIEKFWPSTDGPLKESKAIEWRSDIQVELQDGKVINGWVGILDTMSRDLAGFTLEYRGKSIAGIAAQPEEDAAGISLERGAYKPRRIFGQPGLYADQSIVGSFDLSAFGKSITTDSITWTAEEEEEFVDAVYREMRRPDKDFIAQATNLRRRKIGEKEIESQSSALEREAASLTESLTNSGISHQDPEIVSSENVNPKDVEDFDVVGAEESSHDERVYTVHDAEGHMHEISLRCMNNNGDPFLELQEDSGLGHRVLLNVGHPSIADLAPIDGRVRAILIRIVLAMSSAEIFLDGTALERGRLRRKFNQILDARGRYARENKG